MKEYLALVENPIVPNLSPSDTGFGLSKFQSLILTTVKVLFIVAVLMFLFLFLLGGIKWILSGGDKVKMENARSTLTSAIVGLIIVFSLFAVLKLIEFILGINILEIDIGALKIG